MSLPRARSLSIDALYRPIPQEPETVPLNQDPPEEDVEHSQPRITPSTNSVVDTKVWWIYFILGCSVLLPWNVVITAMPYFAERLSGSGIQQTFGSYLSTSCTASNFVFLAHATVTSKHTSPSSRANKSIYCLVVLTSLLVISTYFTLPPGLFFAFILINGAAQSAAGSYLQTAVIAVASLFGPAAVQAVMSGQAAVAVAVSGVQVVSAAASTWGQPRTYISDGSAEERSAFMFFSLSTLFLLLSAAAHTWLVSMPSYRAVAASLEHNAAKSQQNSTSLSTQPLVSRGRSEAGDDRRQAIRVAKANIMYEVAVAYVFLITLAVFPPITTSIMPVNPETHPLLFTSIHFLVFNVGDLLGRYLCSFPIFHIWSRKRLLGISLARTFFIPLFLMCNVQRPSHLLATTTPIINSDFLFMFILLVFGLTNGYVGSSCMMSAPSLEHNPRLKGNVEDVDVAATVASFFLVGGLVLGSIASFAVKGTICQCNPFKS